MARGPWLAAHGRLGGLQVDKVAFYCIFLTDFSGKGHHHWNGLEIGKNTPDPILKAMGFKILDKFA